MKKTIYTFYIFLFLFSGFSETSGQKPIKQGPAVPSGFTVSPMEMKLYNMINEYRQRYDLPPILLSRSLCFVASTHAKDLFFHHPDVQPCNFHSWSDKGNWKPFCYPRDEKKNNSVWDKPKELTKYNGKGYEIVYWENNPVNIDSIIPFWRSIDYFNSFLMNTGKWKDKKWNAIGIGIYENYACAWFGEVPDEETTLPGAVKVTEKSHPSENIKSDTLKAPASSRKAVPAAKNESKPPVKVEPKPIVKGVYYIIVKSGLPVNVMKKTVSDLISQGYRGTKLLARDNKLRVSIMEMDTKPRADSALREVRKIFHDAWILK